MKITHYPNAILHGGPSSLGAHERIRHTEDLTDKIKVLAGNRYEHFEPTPEVDRSLGQDLVVYVWKECTYVAE